MQTRRRIQTTTGTRIAPRRYTARKTRRHNPKRRRPLAVVCIIILMIMAATAIAPSTGMRLNSPADISTPHVEWREGTVPHLYQTDPAWADHPYAGGDVRTNGCGPTCLSMVYVALTGKDDLDPAGMADFAERGGHTANGMTAWTLMTDGAAALGLVAQELPADAGAVAGALGEARPIICSVRPGDFTTTGHFIVLVGMTDDGQVNVNDPNSPERSAHPWDLERVLGQCSNLWAYTR